MNQTLSYVVESKEIQEIFIVGILCKPSWVILKPDLSLGDVLEGRCAA